MGGAQLTPQKKQRSSQLFDWKTFPTKALQQNHLPKCELVLDPPSYRLMKGTDAKKRPTFCSWTLRFVSCILAHPTLSEALKRRQPEVRVEKAVKGWVAFFGLIDLPSRKKT